MRKEESFYGWNIKLPKKKEEEKKKAHPGISIIVGIFSFLFGMLFFLDGWGRYSLYPVVSQAVKQEILFEILLGLFFVIVGLVLIIGFIDYAKEKE